MEVRDALNRYPKTVALAVIVLIAAIIYFLLPRGGTTTSQTIAAASQTWYTVDDGQTWFAADVNKLSPFDHDGKQAFRCYVWTCDGGKTKYVSHLERIKPAVMKSFAGKTKIEPWEMIPGSIEIKAPKTGDSGWVDKDAPGAERLQTPSCPAGGKDLPVPVRP